MEGSLYVPWWFVGMIVSYILGITTCLIVLYLIIRRGMKDQETSLHSLRSADAANEISKILEDYMDETEEL